MKETVIKTNRRMTYTNVKKILADKDAAVIEEYKELVPMFEKMAELAAILRKKRMKRGSIDFDFPETKVVLDEDGHPAVCLYDCLCNLMIDNFTLFIYCHNA